MTAPRIVFFSGGSALKNLARTLAARYPFTAHLVAAFDSGGSTAALRKAFAIPAVGDLRNRLLALADPEWISEDIRALWNTRIARDVSPGRAREELLRYGSSLAPPWQAIGAEASRMPLRCLRQFFQRMPPDFDARGACLGNLFIAGAYLEFNRDFLPVLSLFHQYLRVRGAALPIVDSNLHLGAILKDGSPVIGQHLFKSLPSPVRSLFLTVHETSLALEEDPVACRPAVFPEAADFIRRGKAVVFPMGSFYSSIVSNLIPKGVGEAVASSRGAKIFIPNSGRDPELAGLDIPGQARVILDTLRADAPDAPTERLLQYVLIDDKRGVYPGGYGKSVERRLAELGVAPIYREMISEGDPSRHDPAAILNVLRELAER